MKPKFYIILAIILIALCFISVYVFTLPTFIERYNLTNTSNIGSTIGGITAPILGIISSIFLYLALSKQTDGNEKSRIKNESDIIFLMLNQLDSEFDKFYYKYSQGSGKDKVVTKFTGIEAMHEFVNDFCYEWTFTDFKYSNMFQAKQIALLTNSFYLIQSRLDKSFLDDTLKLQIEQKLRYTYLFKFYEEISQILKKCDELGKDEQLIRDLKQFHNYFNKKYGL
ncbi:hypothetical protein [Flavobacterium filum]|uniref:hypothetical protein n=1 Tax=Flavobacterium filum TaxID=370974 RepID=UPI0023F0D03E|nr:hypothetical protein [Flavobacterium filum]